MVTRKKVQRRKSRIQRKRRIHTKRYRGGVSLIPSETFYFRVDVYDQNENVLQPNAMNPNLIQAIVERFQNEKAPIGEIGQQFFDITYSYLGDNGVYSVSFKDRYHNVPVGLVPQCNGFIQLDESQSKLMFENNLYLLEPYCIAYEPVNNNVNMYQA